MNTKKTTSLAITTLLISTVIFMAYANTLSSQASSASLTVCNSGTCPKGSYATLQAAIAAAQPGQSILVEPGTYQEQDVINKSLTISGTAGRTTILAPPTLVADPLCNVVAWPVTSTVPLVTVWPTTLSQGATLSWVAAGMTPNGTVQLWINDIPFTPNLNASASGVVSGSFTIGTNVVVGTATVKVVDLSTGRSATEDITVSSNPVTSKCAYPLNNVARDIISISNSAVVTMSGLTISGPSANLTNGIFVYGGANLILKNSEITTVRCLSCYSELGTVSLQLGARGNLGVWETGYATLTNVKIDNYQYFGIGVGGSGSMLTISKSTLTGVGATSSNSQIGINVYGGASANIQTTKISGNTYTGVSSGPNIETDTMSSGIRLWDAGTSTVIKSNTITTSDVDIIAIGTNAISSLTMTSNKFYNPTYYGVVLQDSNLTLSKNTFKGGLYGVAVVADSQTTTALLVKNTFSDQTDGSLFTWALPSYQATVTLK